MHKNILSFVFFFSGLNAGFSTLNELQHYAAQHDGYAISTPIDIQYPVFSHLYQQYKPSWLTRIGISNTSWSAQQFKKLIEICKKIPQKNELNLSPESQLYVWGDLYGDMHSLIVDLAYCVNTLKILNNDLLITDENTYFIFLGNTVGLTPYSLETLTIILTLLSKNPERVLYVVGALEQDGMWESTTMADQLKIYAPHLQYMKDFGIPLAYLINSFFKILPDKIIVKIDGKEPSLTLQHVAKNDRQDINGVIVSGESLLPLHQTKGLQFIGYTQGKATWSLISCPTPLYQLYYNFHQNSFARIYLKDTLATSIITSFVQQVGSKEPFTHNDFSLWNGTRSTQKPQDLTQYIIGSLMPLTGSQSMIGTMVYYGILAGLYLHNPEEKPILVRDIVFDDQNSSPKSYHAIQKLEQMNVRIMLMPVGNTAFQAYYRSLLQQKMFVLFPYSGNMLLRNNSLNNVINLLPSHKEELALLIPFIIKHYQARNIALVYQDDASELDTIKIAHTLLQAYQVNVKDIPYMSAQNDFSQQIELLKNNNIDTIGFFGPHSGLQILIEQMGAETLFNKHIFGLSYLNSIDLKNFLHHMGLSITITSGGLPNPYENSIPLVKNYQQAMDLLSLPYEYQSLVGFISAQLLQDALQQLKPPFIPSEIIRYFEQLNNYNFNGLKLTFDPQTRSLGLRPIITRI